MKPIISKADVDTLREQAKKLMGHVEPERKLYRCLACDYSDSSWEALKTHYKTAHGETLGRLREPYEVKKSVSGFDMQQEFDTIYKSDMETLNKLISSIALPSNLPEDYLSCLWKAPGFIALVESSIKSTSVFDFFGYPYKKVVIKSR